MIAIIEYLAEHQPYFENFNKAWIEQFFWLEEIDRFVLEHPDKAILADGGAILMATYNGEVAGTVALKKVNATVFEFTKMAVGEPYRRKGIAEALSLASLEKAKQLGASKVILYSNTTLEGAVELYRKVGFKQVPQSDTIYKRSDIKMEISLHSPTSKTIKHGSDCRF